jgi:hypothetical protein
MSTSPVATAADYADAMMSARRAKNVLFLLLLLIIICQVAVFFVLRRNAAVWELATGTGTATATHSQILELRVMECFTSIADFAGIALVIVLSFVLLLLVKIMLVGRLIGVSKVTSAYLWCLLLIVLLFPWQSLLLSPVNAPASSVESVDTKFRVPGILYTWGEVTNSVHGARFECPTGKWTASVLHWARYVGFPAVGFILLLVVQANSSRGMSLALGEVEYELPRAPIAT